VSVELNSHILFALGAEHVVMLSIVAPINVRAILRAVNVCVPLDPLADLKLSLAVGLRAEVHCSVVTIYGLANRVFVFNAESRVLGILGRFGTLLSVEEIVKRDRVPSLAGGSCDEPHRALLLPVLPPVHLQTSP
jgi:hypothetical protein